MDGAIPGMIDLTVVLNEGADEYAADIALRTRWEDLEAYRAYRAHPLHLEVRSVVLGLMTDAMTIDYTVGTVGTVGTSDG